MLVHGANSRSEGPLPELDSRTMTAQSRSPIDLAQAIDHTLLRPNATAAEIDQLCAEAVTHRFATACVNGAWARRCVANLAGSSVAVCAVVAFPFGAMATEAKVFEAVRALEDGAREIDVVQNVGALRSGLLDWVERDLAAVVEVCKARGALVKAILETSLLTDPLKIDACRIAVRAGADFVKTSTGFAGGGATVEDVRMIHELVGPAIGVKASGGIRERSQALAMLAAGATRLGCSASIDIIAAGRFADR